MTCSMSFPALILVSCVLFCGIILVILVVFNVDEKAQKEAKGKRAFHYHSLMLRGWSNTLEKRVFFVTSFPSSPYEMLVVWDGDLHEMVHFLT